MNDLIIGAVIIVLISVCCFWLAVIMARRSTGRVPEQLALLTVLLMVLYIWKLWDNVQMAHWLPFSNLIIVGNLFTPAMAFLAGLVWVRLKARPLTQRLILITGLMLTGFFGLIRPVLGKPPICSEDWNGDICMQTTDATCSAASAATLLSYHGITTTEQEMAELCLTRGGTTWKGLYRGLKLKTAGTNLSVEPFSATTEELKEMEGPFILKTGLPLGKEYPAIYEEQWGWVPGRPHSVVLLRFDRTGFGLIGDPSVGAEVWPPDVFGTLYQGEGVRLVKSE